MFEYLKNTFEWRIIVQWVLVLWFVLANLAIVHNLNQNYLDASLREAENNYLNSDRTERATALAEHKFLRDRILYLEGQIDALHSERKTPNYDVKPDYKGIVTKPQNSVRLPLP